jgi:hypothetical protein
MSTSMVEIELFNAENLVVRNDNPMAKYVL